MAGMRRLQQAGLVQHVGVSNYSLARWQAAERALGSPVLSNQVQYSLADPSAEDQLIPYAQRQGRLVIAYSPLAQGFVSGRYGPGNPPSGSVRRFNPLFLDVNLRRGAGLLGVLKQVADAHDATPSQVALAYLVHHPNVVAIPGASSLEQVEANAAAADIDLADEEFDALTAAAHAFHPLTAARAVPQLVSQRLSRRG